MFLFKEWFYNLLSKLWFFFYYYYFFYLQANKQHSEREKYFVPVCQTRHFVKVGGTKQWECWEGKLNSISCLGVTARRSWVMLPGKQFLRFHCSLSRSITALLNEHLNGHNCRATESGKNSFFDTTENARNYTPDRKLSAIASPALLQFYCKPALSWNQYGKISMNPRVTNHTATGFTWKKKNSERSIYQVTCDLDSKHVWFSKIILSGCLILCLARGRRESKESRVPRAVGWCPFVLAVAQTCENLQTKPTRQRNGMSKERNLPSFSIGEWGHGKMK